MSLSNFSTFIRVESLCRCMDCGVMVSALPFSFLSMHSPPRLTSTPHARPLPPHAMAYKTNMLSLTDFPLPVIPIYQASSPLLSSTTIPTSRIRLDSVSVRSDLTPDPTNRGLVELHRRRTIPRPAFSGGLSCLFTDIRRQLAHYLPRSHQNERWWEAQQAAEGDTRR